LFYSCQNAIMGKFCDLKVLFLDVFNINVMD
jgi:hypothetical protein